MDGIGSASSAVQDQVAISVLKKAMDQQARPVEAMERTLDLQNQTQPAKQAPPSPDQNVGRKIDIFG